MADTLLQTYLNNQFIKTSDEGNIAQLRKAATEVAKRLRKKKAKVIPYTLVGIDPLISEDDPVIVEVEKIIIGKWRTFKNGITQTKEKATTYIRAVILEALRQLAKEEQFAALIWLTSRDVISFFDTSGEKLVLRDFLIQIGDEIEAKSQVQWGLDRMVSLNGLDMSSMNLSVKSVKGISISEESIENHLLDAAQYHRWAGSSNQIGSNPQQPNNQLWAPHFAKHSAIGLVQELNEAFSIQRRKFAISSRFTPKGIKESQLSASIDNQRSFSSFNQWSYN